MSSIKIDGERIVFYEPSDDPSDVINLKKPEVRVKTKIDGNNIKIDLQGQSVDYSVSNAIRLTIMTMIPVFAYHRSMLTVEKKDRGYSNSYNNDTIETILENTPIYDIFHEFDILDPENYLPNDVLRTIYSSFVQEKYEDIRDIESKITNMQINKDGTYRKQEEPNKKIPKIIFSLVAENRDPVKTFYVGTHDAKFTIDGEPSDSYLKRGRIDLFKLGPGESISLTVQAVLGISIMNGIHNATDIVVSRMVEDDENHWIIEYNSLGQLTPKSIFKKACIILIRKLDLLGKFIDENYKNKIQKDQYVEINISGEDHAMGNVISTTLKKSKDVKEASYTKPHELVSAIVIQYKLEENSKLKDPIDALLDVLNYLMNVFEMIEKTIK